MGLHFKESPVETGHVLLAISKQSAGKDSNLLGAAMHGPCLFHEAIFYP